MASGIQPERNVLFALWDGEEKGLLGSEHFMLNWDDPTKIKGYLNFDMIGRNNNEANPEHVVYFYTAAYPEFENGCAETLKSEGWHLNPIIVRGTDLSAVATTAPLPRGMYPSYGITPTDTKTITCPATMPIKSITPKRLT